MIYGITFLEGVLTFISPCLLPMLPIYLSFLAGNTTEGKNTTMIKNALGFVLGFTAVFVLLGVAAATFGVFLKSHMQLVNVVGGIIVICFGINFTGFVHLPFLNKTKVLDVHVKVTGFLSAMLFGAVFSIGWVPCVGTFLGAALTQAVAAETFYTGVVLLLVYSVGLGIPFMLSALFFHKLKSTFTFIKKHYTAINRASGIFLIILGLLMLTGHFNSFIALFR